MHLNKNVTIIIQGMFSKYSQLIKLNIKTTYKISELKNPSIEIIKNATPAGPKSPRPLFVWLLSLPAVIIEIRQAINKIVTVNLNIPARDFMYERLKKGIDGGNLFNVNECLLIEKKLVDIFEVDIEFDVFGSILFILVYTMSK